jgi:hypothetical protein
LLREPAERLVEVILRWKLALRADPVDNLRQYVGHRLRGLVPRHAELLGDPVDLVVANSPLDPLSADGLVVSEAERALRGPVST